MPEKLKHKPNVSVVVVVYNMPREAPRTLHSLSAAYQRHIDPDDYEVIVVDNGSNPPFDPKTIDGLSGNFRLIRIHPAPPSPAQAVNRGLAEARGEVIGVMIDGACIVTPSLLHFARHGACLHDHAVVVAPGWFLGSDFQRWALQAGYDRAREDALLAAIGWPEDGYRLFEIATPDRSSCEGWLQPIAEANALFMRRSAWDTLDGVDERFDAPGGGYVNPDTYARAMELPDAQLVLLLGEGTFHQLHGGIATNASNQQLRDNLSTWGDQYERIRGRRYQTCQPTRSPMYVGTLPRPALVHFVRSAIAPIRGHSTPPLGTGFDQRLWSPSPPQRPTDPVVAALVDLAQQEFALGHYAATVNIARLARSRAPDEEEPQRLLSLTACAKVLDQDDCPSAEFFYALGEAYRVLGDHDLAASHYRQALALNRNFERAHVGLATLRLPGDLYYAWLERLYRFLSPATAIEIGVADGRSLARVQPPTMAIGVDPNPMLTQPLRAETHIFPETSDAFFARRGPDALLAGRPLGIGFIDGLHLFEQALRDFIHLEAYCDPRSVILIHDTLPLDEATQSRARDTQFHTGDVWKVVLCLKHYRPDLEIFTIGTPWTGLTVVTGLDSQSRVLGAAYEEAVARFIDTPYAEIEHNPEVALNLVPNDWQLVEARLEARRGTSARTRSSVAAPMQIKAMLATHHLPEESLPWMAEAREVFGELIIFIDEKRSKAGTESRAKSVGTRVHHHRANAWYDWDLGAMARACESDWVFIIEYDEQLSPEWQQQSWRHILERTEFTHFWCPRRWVVPGGRYITSEPWWPDFQLRLVRNGVAGTTFPTRLHDPISIPGPGGHFQHLALYHHVLWLWSRPAREERARYYEELRPGHGLGHYYLYEDYGCPTATLPEAMAWDADRVVPRMDTLAPDAVARISLDVGAVPAEVGVSEIFWIGVTVRNATNRPLASSPPFPVRLAYHWIHESTRGMVVFDGQRSDLFPCVQANDSMRCWIRVVAPNLPGKYILQTTMLQEAVCWFEDVRPDILREFEVVASDKRDRREGTS